METPVFHLASGERRSQARAMSMVLAVVGSAGLAAGLMYLFDPDRGARRRGILLDRLAGLSRRSSGGIGGALHDLRDRARALPAIGGESVFRDDAPVQTERPQVLQTEWTPGQRQLAAAAGAGLAFYGLTRRGVAGALAGTAGAGLLASALTNTDLHRLLGLGGRRGVDLRRTIDIDAPLGDVYAYWADLENFPRIMSHVQDVKKTGPDRFRWRVTAAGIPVEWDAIVTKCVPNELLTWKSDDGSIIRQAGAVRFEERPGAGTRLDLRLSYNPPLGALGHTVASLLGADPGSMIDDDLMRFKSLMETGETRAHGHTVTLDDLPPPAPLTAEAGASHVRQA